MGFPIKKHLSDIDCALGFISKPSSELGINNQETGILKRTTVGLVYSEVR